MATRYRIERTTEGWWLVMSRRWLRWRRDEFMYSARELAEDRLRDLREGEARLAGAALPGPTHRPQSTPPSTLRSRHPLQVVSR
jgi:hypothetical protein